LQRLGGHHGRLAHLIGDDPPRLPAREAQRALEVAHHRVGVVLERGRLEPPHVGALQGGRTFFGGVGR